MTDKKKELISDDLLMMDVLIRLKSIETLLYSKKVFTKEEYVIEMDSLTKEIMKSFIVKNNIQENLDNLLEKPKSDN